MNNFIANNNYPPRVLASPQYKIAMYWSPKAGCSLLAKMFLEYIHIYDPQKNPIDQRASYANIMHQTHAHKGDKSLLCDQHHVFYQKYFKLQLVRNPYARVVSSFLKYLHVSMNRISLSFQQYLELLLSGNSDTKCFLEHHCLPQFMTDSLDYIIKLENIQNDIQKLKYRYHILLPYNENPVEPSYQNTHHYNNTIANTCSNFRYRFIKLTDGSEKIINTDTQIAGVPSYNLFYNEYCYKIVSTLYAKDIEFFNYKFPYEIN